MRRLEVWLIAALALTLAAGGTLGYVAAGRLGVAGRGALSSPSRLLTEEYKSYWLLRSQDVWNELGLDETQRRQIGELLAAHYREDRELRKRLEELAQGTNVDLVEILTDEQRNSLGAIQTRYEEERIESEAVREVVLLRRKLELTNEQEHDVYLAIYDSIADARRVFKDIREREDCDARQARQEIRKGFDEINQRRSQRMASILDAEQLAAYQRFEDEKRRLWERHRKGGDRGERGDRGDREHRGPSRRGGRDGRDDGPEGRDGPDGPDGREEPEVRVPEARGRPGAEAPLPASPSAP